MRDLYDAQAWADHHDQASLWLGNAFAAVGAQLRQTGAIAQRVPGQLVAGFFALGLTLVTFAGSAA